MINLVRYQGLLMAGIGARSELARTGGNGCDKSSEFGDQSCIHLTIHVKTTGYSDLRLFTGLPKAALSAW